MPTNYHYDATTGEYAGSLEARPSPKQKGAYLRPAYTTRTAPPEAEAGKARVFASSEWSQVADHRGETWFHQGKAVTVKEIGNPLQMGLVQKPPMNVGEDAEWVENGWVVKPDHRGEMWWIAHGKSMKVETLGNPADWGWFSKEPAAPPVKTNNEIDQETLNYVLAEEGSIFRALGILMFKEINKLRVANGEKAYTLAQFKTALQNEMRS